MKKLTDIFTEVLEVDGDLVNDDLKYNAIPEWDSIAHMALVAELDDAFDIMLDTDDILDMSSFAKAKEILTKYGVNFEE